jgi:hypothetical protein
VISGTVAVRIGVLDTNRDRVFHAQRCVNLVRAHFPHDYCAFSHIQLHAVVSDPQTHAKAKCITQPSRGLIRPDTLALE